MRQIVEEMIVARKPQARITLLAADPTGAGQYGRALLEQGIEVVWPSDVEAAADPAVSLLDMSSLSPVTSGMSTGPTNQPQALRVERRRRSSSAAWTGWGSQLLTRPRRLAVLRQTAWEVTAAAEADARGASPRRRKPCC